MIILGGGESGIGAALLSKQQGYDVFLSDAGQMQTHFVNELNENQILFEQGGHTESMIINADIVVKSPGIPEKTAIVKQLRMLQIPIISEIEFAYQYIQNSKVVAITGSNGKSTTTALTYHICKHANLDCAMVGNIGYSFARQVATEPKAIYVVEVSSFQLETIETFRPRIAVYLNLTPDHLDRYSTMESYAAAKARIFENQKAEDVAVINKRLVLPKGHARKIVFTAEATGAEYTLQEGWLCAHGEKVMRQDATKLQGEHNAENLLAALAVADAMEISREVVKKVFSSYQALPHRCEVVAVRAGVTWINDSKATNLDAMERAVSGLVGPVILIAGGKDKGFDARTSRPALEGKVRAVFLLGEMAEKMEKAWSGGMPCRRVQDLGEAVRRAAEMAREGENVLLSPGCSSYDQFKNFEERGEKYRQCVIALPQEENKP